MKTLLILAALLAGSWAAPADTCDNSFGAYLNALKDEIQTKGKDLEVEFRDDYYKLVRQCFANSADDSSKCALTDEELKGDVYGENGPLKGCDRCQKLASSLRDKFLKSDDATRKCFRTHFAQAVREELEPCIQAKISNGYSFKAPPIPDFDENSKANLDIILQGIDARIAGKSRLDACKAVNPAKFQSTGPCMDKEYSGIYALHCQVGKAAKAKVVSASCASRFDEVRKATCQCMDEKRDDWHQRFAKIQDIVSNAKSASECGKDISDVVGAWLNKLQSAMTDCLPKDANSPTEKRDLRTLIELGCGQVINGGVKKNELTVGFRFVRLLLDALNDRLTVYCDKNCA